MKNNMQKVTFKENISSLHGTFKRGDTQSVSKEFADEVSNAGLADLSPDAPKVEENTKRKAKIENEE